VTDTLLEHEIDLREAPGLSGRLLNGRRYPTTSAVIPTLNEERNIGHVLEDMPDCVTQVVLVDGLSTDRTIEVAREVRPDLRLVMETKRGKGAALAAGFRAATCDVIVMLDADGSTQPQEIPRFLDALVAGADFVKGSRFADGGGSSDITPLRRAGNKSFAHVVNFLWGTDFGDLCYGYNAFWRDCLEHVVIDSAGFEVETLLAIRAARAGLRIDEVPSYESPRMFGESNLRTFPDGVRVLRTILAERIRP
jgi:glycosyltransferase involved in cell wall biosynthesis